MALGTSNVVVATTTADADVGAVILRWTINDPNEFGLPYLRYKEVEVWRATNPTMTGEVKIANAGGGQFSDVTGILGATYFYRLRAVNQSDQVGDTYGPIVAQASSATDVAPWVEVGVADLSSAVFYVYNITSVPAAIFTAVYPTATLAMRFKQIGRTVWLRGQVDVANKGGAAGFGMWVPLPVAAFRGALESGRLVRGDATVYEASTSQLSKAIASLTFTGTLLPDGHYLQLRKPAIGLPAGGTSGDLFAGNGGKVRFAICYEALS